MASRANTLDSTHSGTSLRTFVDHLVGALGVRREATALALDVGDLVAQARRQVAEFFAAVDRILALESQQQTHMEDLQRLHVHGALAAQGVEAVEEVFAGQLVAKDQQLQRAPFPLLAQGERRAQDDFVDGRAERILGRLDIVAIGADLFRLAVEVVEEGRDAVHEGFARRRGAAPFFSMNSI